MLRKFALLLAAVSFCALAAFMVACGSSSNHSITQCTGTYTVVGDWQGSFISGGTTDDLVGVINSAGSAVLFDNEADIATIDSITGACSFSAALSAYASIESGDEGTATGTATGNVTSDTAFNGNESVNSTSGTFAFTSYNPLGTGTVSAVSGTALAAVEGQVVDDLTLTLGGTASAITFTGTDGTCTFNGTATEETTYNVYDVTFDVSGNGCEAINYTGPGFESDSDLLDANEGAAGTYLYAVLTSSSTPFVVEIFPTVGGQSHHAHRPPAKNAAFPRLFGFHRRSSR